MDLVLFNFHDVVLLITVFLCVLFSVYLFVIKRDSPLSNLLFAGFLMCNAAIPFDILLNFGAAFHEWAVQALPNGFHLFELGYWLEGPLLLWYVRSILYKGYKLKRNDLIYLIPSFLFVIDQAFSYYSLPVELKQQLLLSTDLYATSESIMSITYIREVCRVLFGVFCAAELVRHRNLVKHNYSNSEAINFNWLAFLIVGFLGVRIWSLVVVTSVNLSVKLGWDINYALMGLSGNYAVMFLIAISILLCASYARGVGGVDRNKLVGNDYAISSFDNSDIEKIKKAFSVDQIHLDGDLTLLKLSKAVGMPARLVSAILNHHFKKRFFEYVNDYRIEEARKILCSRKHSRKSITDVMCASGFNSKATFNSLFKKDLGVTPSEYRLRMLGKKQLSASGRWRHEVFD